MTVRTKSRTDQWCLWLCGALVALGAYVVLSRLLYGSVSFDLGDPLRYRLAMPIVVLLACAAWETRWDGVVRKSEGKGPERSASARREPAEARVQGTEAERRSPAAPTVRQPPVSDLPGEDLFEQARSIPHQPIPDFEVDGRYLKLLGQSAEAGSARASAKLGEYAMRRNAWVEAYFWMWQARRQGMLNLETVMREIRQSWARDGYQDEPENVHPLFDVEAGSIGRALLHVDSGHEAANARAFLKRNHPQCLSAGY